MGEVLSESVTIRVQNATEQSECLSQCCSSFTGWCDISAGSPQLQSYSQERTGGRSEDLYLCFVNLHRIYLNFSMKPADFLLRSDLSIDSIIPNTVHFNKYDNLCK